MTQINSQIEFCQKESEAISAIGRDKILEIYNQLKKDLNQCACCGYDPKSSQKLKLHFVSSDYKAVLLCDVCFLLKHFQKAIEDNCVVLANSEFSQVDLIRIQRMSNKTTNKEIIKKTIVVLKQSPKEYAELIQIDKRMFSSYIKVLFNNNFKWDNCK